MSLFTEAQATVLVGDVITIDGGSGKLYGLGLAFQFVPAPPPAHLTPPMSVAAIVDLPRKYEGQQVPFSLELRDETAGQVVAMMESDGTNERPTYSTAHAR